MPLESIKPSQKIIGGLLMGLALTLVDRFMINGPTATLISLALQASILIYGVARGLKAPLALRAFLSILVLNWAFGACLMGRTTGPGLTGETSGMAVTTLLLYGAVPGLALIRFWPRRVGAASFLALFPLAFLLATTAAGLEEYLFVQKYQSTGVGPTSRWTVSMHWLAYDKGTHRLGGSD